MRKFIYIYLAVFICFLHAKKLHGQDSCQMALVNATEAFDKGMYNDVVLLLEGRINHCDYSAEARLQGLKILAASYAELDEVEMAEKTTKEFISKAPVYKIQSIDPQHFVNTLDKFSVMPKLSLGISAGLQSSIFQVNKQFKAWDADGYHSGYSSSGKVAFNVSVQYNLTRKLAIGTEIGYCSLGYTRDINYGTTYSIKYSEDVTQITTPVYLTYNILNIKKVSVSLLSGIYAYRNNNVSYTYTNNYLGTTSKVSGITSSGRNMLGAGLIEGLRFSYPIKQFNFTFEPRFYYSQTLYNNPNERYSITNNSNILYVDDNFKINRLEFLFGVSYNLTYKIKHKYH